MAGASASQGQREDVMTFLIVVVVLVVAAVAAAYRYDRKHRGRANYSGGGTTARQLRLDGREMGSRWGAGGGG